MHRILQISFVSLSALSAAAVCLTALLATGPEIGRQTLWFAGTAGIALLCAALLWISARRKVTLSMVDAAAGGFFLWYLFCYYSNGSIASSGLIENGYLALAYLAFRVLFAAWRSGNRWVAAVICLCGLVEAVTGIRQAMGLEPSAHHLFRVTGTFFNPGPYGGYLSVVFALAAGVIAAGYRVVPAAVDFRDHRKQWLARGLWVLCFFLAVGAAGAIGIILPSTLSRAAFVAVAVAIAVIILRDRKVYPALRTFFRKHRRVCLIGGAVGLVLLSTAAYGLYTVKKDSADGRLLMWKVSAKVALDHPLTGVGPGYFRGAYGEAQADYFRAASRSETERRVAGSPEYGFNEYLQIGMETGAVGLILFLILIIMALRRLFRGRNSMACGLLALLVFAFFSYPFSILPMKVLLIVFLAAAGAQRRRHHLAGTGEMILIGTMLAAGLAAAWLLSDPLKRRVDAVDAWRESRRWYTMEFYDYVLEDYPALLPLMKENQAFLFEYGRSLHLEGQHRESVEILRLAVRQSADPMQYNVLGNAYKALGRYGKAAECYLKAQDMVPHRIYPNYLLAKLYDELGDRRAAALYARRLLATPLKVESPATRDLRREMEALLRNGPGGEAAEKE